ncbi:hypothetical protein BKA65DRAFT_592980 [Rhexocercosporidium sp. MPI-PUGE-AT-0058]|nr:hypothetical protein BKA65DRAFT_592980 [Rhexocercosporidium sp. MPI-PUGE-AT-0058]
MKFITSLLMVALLTISALAATTSHLGGPFNGLPLPLEPMEFNLTIDGNSFHSHGTIQQVYSQYAAENLSFKFPDTLSLSSALELKAASAHAQSNVEKRSKGNIYCLPNPVVQWVLAPENGIWADINFLKGIQPDLCRFAPRTCRKLACYDSASLFVCNYADVALWRACSYMGSYAEDIINHCPQYRSAGYVGGQEDDSDGYAIIVRGDPCQ